MSEQGNKPVREFRVSGGISAAVWRRTATVDGRTVVRHSVRFQKRYRDKKTGEWADSHYYYPRDLPLLLLAKRRLHSGSRIAHHPRWAILSSATFTMPPVPGR